MFWKKLLTVAIVTPTLLGTGWAAVPQTKKNVAEVDQCEIKWKDQRVISSPIPGIIDKLLVREGMQVNPDDVIALLDDRETKLQYIIQKELASSMTAIESAELRLQEYYTRKAIADDLYKEQAETQENRRLAGVQVGITILEKKTEVEKQKVETMKKDQLEFALDQHQIKSPIRGVIRRLPKRERESVTAGEDLIIAEIVDTSVVWVEAPVPLKYLYKVKEGQTATVKLSATWFRDITQESNVDIPELSREFKGRVIYIDPNIVQSQRGVFQVRIEVSNTDGILRAGGKAHVEIDLGSPNTITATSNR